MNNPGVSVGPPMTDEEEHDHKRRLALLYADEADRAVVVIEEKVAGMQESLKAAKAEAKRLRAEVE